MKLKDMTDQGIIAADSAPPGTLSSVPPIEDFRISVEGILKLLKNLKPGKAAGPDKLKVGGKKGNRTEPNRTNGLYRTEPTKISDCCGTGFYLRHRTESNECDIYWLFYHYFFSVY